MKPGPSSRTSIYMSLPSFGNLEESFVYCRGTDVPCAFLWKTSNPLKLLSFKPGLSVRRLVYLHLPLKSWGILGNVSRGTEGPVPFFLRHF